MAEQESRLAIRIDSQQALRDSKELARELDNITRSGNNVETQANAAGFALKNLAGYMAGVVTVGNAISKMDSYTGIQNRLKLVTKSQEELNAAMESTFGIAARAAQSWDAVTSVYTKYLSNAKTLKISQEDVAKLTEITSKAVAMSGSTAEAAAGALFQYGQALDGGVLRAEEFNSLVDGAGGLLNAMAEGLGITRGELRQMMLDGKLTGEVIAKSLLKARTSVEDLYAKTDTTIGESFTVLNDALIKFVGEAGKSSGAATALSNAVKALATNLDTIAHIAILGGVAAITKAIVTQVIAMKSSIAASVQRLTAAEIAHNIALNANSKATAANTAATTANNAAKTLGARAAALASAAFLGPAGIVIGVTALTAGYLLMSNHGGDANDMLKDQANYAGMAADELERLSGNQAKAAKADLTSAIKTQSQELKNVKRDFEDLVLALYKESDNKDLYRIWAEITAGVLDTEEAFKRLNAVEGIEASDIKRAADYEKEHRDLNKTLLDSKEKLKLVENGIDGTGKKAKESAEEVANLTAELQKLFKQSNQDIRVLEATAAMNKNNVPKELMDIVNKYLNIEGAIDKATGKFKREIKDQINKEWIATKKSLEATEKRNKLEEARTKELEKQAKLVKSGTIDSLIARGEGGYNSVNLGKKHGYKSSTRNLTQMTVGQVMAAQDRGEFNAAGRNQIIKTTLREAVSGLKIDKNALFNEEMQDRILRDYLLDLKNPQIKGFITGKGSIGSAINALPKEFASFGVASDMQGAKRRVKKGESYYADVANNKASISAEEAANALLASRKVYQENLAAGMSAQQAWENTFAKQREVVGYTKDNALDLDKFLDEAAQAEADRQAFQAEERKRIANEVADYETQVRNRLKDELEKVDAAGFSDADAKKAKDFYEKQANLDIQAFKDAQQAKLDALKDFQLTEAQLINKRASDQEKDLKRKQELGELTLEQYTEGSLLIEKRRKQEIAAANAARDARINAANEANMSVSDAAHKRYAEEMKQLDQIIDKEEALAIERGINRQYISLGVGPEGTYFDGFSTNSDQIQLGQEDQLNSLYIKQFEEMQLRYAQQRELAIQQNKELTQIEADYLEEKARLNDQYNERIGVARQADHEAQLSMYSSMLSQASSVWGDMTQIVRDTQGEQSGIYKAMFLAQQMFAIGSAMISTHLAATQAMAAPDMVLFGQKIAAPAAITALGYANVGMIAAQTLAGFKDGGLITGAGTGTSDSILIRASNEEFMMRNAAVKSIGVDNLNYMNKYGKLPEQTNRVGNNIANTMTGGAVNVQVEPKIIVNVPEGYTAQQSQSSDGTITLDIVDQMTAQNLSSPNSKTSKALRQNFNAPPRR